MKGVRTIDREDFMQLANRSFLRASRRILIALAIGSTPVCAQNASAPAAPPDQADLEAKIQALTTSLDQTRSELSESRAEIRQLRSLLEQVVQKVGPLGADSVASTSAAPSQNALSVANGNDSAQPSSEPTGAAQHPAQISEDDWQVLNSRVDEQAQDKVETNLKYRLKLSGIVLMNAFGVSGLVDNLDVPTVAEPSFAGAPSGTVGASLRQTVLGLSGFGPEILGAKTSGDIQMDFFGGLPSGYGSASSGVIRLRLARLRLDWTNTSIIAGLDEPFFSPNMPTSYMSVAEPTFSAAGNLWTWTPTIRVEQRLNTDSTQFKIEAGVMDPSADVPPASSTRFPTPGESSRRPTVAVRLSVNSRNEARPVSFGVSGVYSPQYYSWNGTSISGGGAVADWKFGLIPHLEVSGEAFVGKGLDAFGGVAGPVIPTNQYLTYYQSAAPSLLAGITMFGGWAQLKARVNSRNEFNIGIGTGGRVASELNYVVESYPEITAISPRNDAIFVNYIFRPRSDLVFSPEFRRLRTFELGTSPAFADQIGFAAGFLF
jgi:hypothetical protein